MKNGDLGPNIPSDTLKVLINVLNFHDFCPPRRHVHLFMKGTFRHLIFVSLCCLPLCSYAQLPSNRIRPGTMYYAGDTVKSPRLGLQTRVPDGWEGVLPRDSEVFLLMPANNVNGEIYVAVNENLDKAGQIRKWKEGMDLDDGLRLMPDGEITQRGDVICAVGKVTGPKANAANKVYVEAKCSPHGFCLTYMLMANPASYEQAKKALQEFVDYTTFAKPSNESPYLNFNWKKFLSGKVLLMTGYEERGANKRENEVNLCPDGTFTSKVTRKGTFKDQAKGYQGSKKGTWEVKSNGDKATVILTIPKLAPAEVNLEMKNEEVYINGDRYFVGTSEKCK
jgi:hypothetical protein